MIFQLSVVGQDSHSLGRERVIVEDAQIGKITIREIEIGSLDELSRLLDESDAIEMSDSNFSRYDGHLKIDYKTRI